MQYPLSSVHVLIYETIHPNLLLRQPEFLQVEPDAWHPATQQVKALRLCLMDQLVSANGTDALKVAVHSCQAGCTSLINRLSYYITLTEQICTQKKKITFLQKQYGELQRILVSHLLYLQTHFTSYFDLRQPVPAVVWMPKQQEWLLQLGALKEEWLYQQCDPYLAFFIFTAIQNRIAKEPYPTYQQYHYLQMLLTEMETEIGASATPPATERLLNLLIRNNFNHPQVTHYYLQQVQQQIPEDASLQEKADCIAMHLKACQQLYCSEDRWFLQYPSLTESICRAIKQELLFCYRKLKLATLPTGQTVSVSSSNQPLPVVTALSVGQLAVMVRLLVECRIIECNNHSELMKRLANHISTTKAAKISAESLRIKYYAPDTAAINISNEYLHKMLNMLKKL